VHLGKGATVGSVIATREAIAPAAVGVDIGCGMSAVKTSLTASRLPDNLRALRLAFEATVPVGARQHTAPVWLESRTLRPRGESLLRAFLELEPEVQRYLGRLQLQLGTLGGGNHFAELLTIESVEDSTVLKQIGLGKQQLVLLVHSGSRELGESILDRFTKEQFSQGADSFAAREYLREHDFALRWAKANRELIARRFADAIGAETQCLWDGCHNSITSQKHQGGSLWIHRRAALATNDEFVVIPGSRGSLSYLVKVLSDSETHAWSLAHGAGRKWSRSESRLRMRERFGARQLVQTGMGNHVICEDRDLLYGL
jgi:release factor H-coupled RctB family protein